MDTNSVIAVIEKEHPGFRVQVLRTPITIKAGDNKFEFPTNAVIQKKPIVALQALSLDQVTIDAQSNLQNIKMADFKNAVLYLVKPDATAIVRGVSLQTFNRPINNGVLQRFNALGIAWQQCYVQFPNTNTLADGECIILEWWYLIPNTKEDIEEKVRLFVDGVNEG